MKNNKLKVVWFSYEGGSTSIDDLDILVDRARDFPTAELARVRDEEGNTGYIFYTYKRKYTEDEPTTFQLSKALQKAYDRYDDYQE